jgi:hypothetical protein
VSAGSTTGHGWVEQTRWEASPQAISLA